MPPRSSRAAKSQPPSKSPLDVWLDSHTEEIEKLDNGKIRFTLTNVDVPAKLELLEKYYNGKSLRKARDAAELNSLDFSSLPHIIPHKHLKNRLYCTLTKKPLNKIAKEITAHINGRLYQHELKKLNEQIAKQEELEKLRQAKRERLAEARKNGANSNSLSVDDEGVFDRLPDAIADEEDEDEEDDQNGENDDEDDETEESVIIREVDDEDGMPIVRKRETTRKRTRDENKEVAANMEDDDDNNDDGEGFEEVEADDSDDNENEVDEEEEDEEEEEIIEQPKSKRNKANGHVQSAKTNGSENGKSSRSRGQSSQQQTRGSSNGRGGRGGRGRASRR